MWSIPHRARRGGEALWVQEALGPKHVGPCAHFRSDSLSGVAQQGKNTSLALVAFKGICKGTWDGCGIARPRVLVAAQVSNPLPTLTHPYPPAPHLPPPLTWDERRIACPRVQVVAQAVAGAVVEELHAEQPAPRVQAALVQQPPGGGGGLRAYRSILLRLTKACASMQKHATQLSYSSLLWWSHASAQVHRRWARRGGPVRTCRRMLRSLKERHAGMKAPKLPWHAVGSHVKREPHL